MSRIAASFSIKNGSIWERREISSTLVPPPKRAHDSPQSEITGHGNVLPDG